MRKSSFIPVNRAATDLGPGIFVGKIMKSDFHLYEQLEKFDSIKQSHRDEYHLFLLQEEGTTTIEIDFNRFILKPSSVIFIQQNQVHRVEEFRDAAVSIWAISNENLEPAYLKLLEDISPAEPLLLGPDAFLMISEAVSLCLKLAERKDEKLYHSLLKGSCNTLIGLVVSQYLIQSRPVERFSRSEVLTKAFKELLERNFVTSKRPAQYALKLNVSTNYLNECVKRATGHSVSYHIQQRVILEAKRLLFHSDRSVKEISAELGYDDYPYFCRLFSKSAGMTALAFRNKNLD